MSILAHNRPSGISHLVLNTPANLNSFTNDMYRDLISALRHAAADPLVKAVLVSANGKFFSSGMAMSDQQLDLMITNTTPRTNQNTINFIETLIDFPKLLVAAIQGPAFGIAVTSLAHFDLVYASPEATFKTPFSALGICAEGCSSYLFPQMIGKTLTTKLLYLAETVTAEEFLPSGFIHSILHPTSSHTLSDLVLAELEKSLEILSIQSIMTSKALVRPANLRDHLKAVQKLEMENVARLGVSEDFKERMTVFRDLQREKKRAKELLEAQKNAAKL